MGLMSLVSLYLEQFCRLMAGGSGNLAQAVDGAVNRVRDAGLSNETVTNVVASTDDLGGGDYLVYGLLAAVLLVVFGLALRQSKPPKSDVDTVANTPTNDEPRSRRKAFDVPHVLVGDEDAPQVKLVEGVLPEIKNEEEITDATSTDDVPADQTAERAGKTLREGLSKTKSGLIGRLSGLFGARQTLDDDLLGELEEVLFTADIGVRTSQSLVEKVESQLGGKSLSDPQKVWAFLKGEVRDILTQDVAPLNLDASQPFVIMVVGVNGAGKTTTIGKLASQFKREGKSVILAAGDTFRAAAVEQLQEWGNRVGVDVIRGTDKQDPASVLFEAVEQAKNQGVDIVLADTAGRLQAKKALMDELHKVHRVLGKAVEGAPHEVWLVLDSTNGQNAISQAKEFMNVVQVTGLILTKLDGTAKGGVAIGIRDEMKLPIRYIGIGEGVDDLRPFDPAAFADALLGDVEG